MKYCITVSVTYTRGYTIEATDDEDAYQKAEELREKTQDDPGEVEGGGMFVDFAIDQDGRTVCDWSE